MFSLFQSLKSLMWSDKRSCHTTWGLLKTFSHKLSQPWSLTSCPASQRPSILVCCDAVSKRAVSLGRNDLNRGVWFTLQCPQEGHTCMGWGVVNCSRSPGHTRGNFHSRQSHFLFFRKLCHGSDQPRSTHVCYAKGCLSNLTLMFGCLSWTEIYMDEQWMNS